VKNANAFYDDLLRACIHKGVSTNVSSPAHHCRSKLAGRTRETMQVFPQQVTERKIDRLSALITESFRFLLRK
jgi:hypothetical protein